MWCQEQLKPYGYRNFESTLHLCAVTHQCHSFNCPIIMCSKNVKFSRAIRPIRGVADVRFFIHQPDTSLHCKTTTDAGLVHRTVCPVYVAAFAGTRCA